MLGANWQLLRLARLAKCPSFTLSTQNIKFTVLLICNENREFCVANLRFFPLKNTYFGVFVLNGLKEKDMCSQLESEFVL